MKQRIHRKHIFILIGLIILSLIFLSFNYKAEKIFSNQTVTFGISYSPRYAQELGLDPELTFQDILRNLEAKNIRLSAYWDEIEPTKDKFDFRELDWYVDQADKNNVKVILGIGYKLPRWPECRAPEWLNQRHSELGSESFLRERQTLMIGAVIDHFDKNPNIMAWQLENEPLLQFGECPKPDRKFLSQEVTFVRSKTKKPIIITDSGELRLWVTPMKLSDIFGTTLYRVVDTPFFGQFYYPLRPYFYRLRSDLFRSLFARGNQKTIISELQAEGWASQPLREVSIKDQINTLSINQFRETVDFARKTGFSEVYLWGVEWWYYLAQKGHPEYLQFAKTLF